MKEKDKILFSVKNKLGKTFFQNETLKRDRKIKKHAESSNYGFAEDDDDYKMK